MSKDDPRGRKGFFIQTFGCQMNMADTERMQALMQSCGYDVCETPDDAKVILINGCSVREKAVHKAVSALGRMQKIKESGSKYPLIGVGGCVGQLEKDQLFKNAPFLDFVFGPDAIDELPEIIDRVDRGERRLIFANFDKENKYSTETKIYGKKSQAFVNIMKGCDKFCTYCIVPFTRGREKSRTIDEVLDDVAQLVGKGVKEVTLLGQNVNSFGKGNPNVKNREPKVLTNIIGKVGPDGDDENFPQLLRAMESDPRLDGLKRIRFTSSHPLDFSDQLIECYFPKETGGVSKLAQHLHLPVQSGSDRVLRKMGRHHKIENYIDQMERLRRENPGIGISTDLIVGFPTETESEFEETLNLLSRLNFDQVFAFAYSPRPGTRAAKLEDDVLDVDKKRRLNALLQHQLSLSEVNNKKNIGRTFELLVEGEAKNQKMSVPGLKTAKVWTGRSSCNRIVHFISDLPRTLVGELVNVKITKATALAHYGELINEMDPIFAESRTSL